MFYFYLASFISKNKEKSFDILTFKIYIIQAQFFLPSVDGDLTEGKPPINVKFEIPYFTTSGIQVQEDFDALPISVNICSR